MTLQASESRKNEVIRSIIMHNPLFCFLHRLQQTIIPIMSLIAIAYAFLNFLIPGLSEISVNGIIKKQTIDIICEAVLIHVLGVIGHLMIRAFLTNRCIPDLLERSEESVVCENNQLIFLFRHNDIPSPNSRYLIFIPFNRISIIERDLITKKIVFKGNFVSSYAQHYSHTNRYYPTTADLNAFSAYDYYEPSLSEILNEHGLFPILPEQEVPINEISEK